MTHCWRISAHLPIQKCWFSLRLTTKRQSVFFSPRWVITHSPSKKTWWLILCAELSFFFDKKYALVNQHNYGKSYVYWVYPLFLWSFSSWQTVSLPEGTSRFLPEPQEVKKPGGKVATSKRRRLTRLSLHDVCQRDSRWLVFFLEHDWIIFPSIYLEQSSQLTFIFFRGVGQPPTSVPRYPDFGGFQEVETSPIPIREPWCWNIYLQNWVIKMWFLYW